MKFQETESIELKRVLNESFAKEVVAFLNTHDGVIYVGVADDGNVIGVNDTDKVLRSIAETINDKILPNPQEFISFYAKMIQDKVIVEVNIRKGDSLYFVKKYGRSSTGCFKRIGTTTRGMSEEQIERLYNETMLLKRQIIDVPSRKTNLTFSYLKMLYKEKGFSINDDTFEENNKLRTESGKYNIQGELLADENDYSIKVVVFDGEDKASNIIVRNEYGYKCLIVAMKNAFEYCCDVINQTKTIFKNGYRTDIRLFDVDAFREAWFNACLHNNWIIGTPPAIYIFSNHLEIVSTGGLPPKMTKKDFFSSVSRPVNETLARIFIQLGLIENTGHGVQLIVKKYSRDIFEFLDSAIKVNIPFNYKLKNNVADDDENVANNVADDDENVANNVADSKDDVADIEDFDSDEEKIIKEIKKNNQITRTQLANIINKSKKTVERIIKNSKRIIRIGSPKNGHWEIKS